MQESAYYGIPENIDYDGVDENGNLCATDDRTKRYIKECRPMRKRFFLHYQWLPFYISSLALMYYFPYILYQTINTDMISLDNLIQDENTDAAKLAKNYFNYKLNSKLSMRFRVLCNLLIKKLYIMINMGGFILTDRVLEGRYFNYGFEWCNWHIMPNSIAYDITKRTSPKPGNFILPSWGLCDLHEALRDVRTTTINRHKFICEVSPHIIYQYILIILWFFFNIGIAVSTLGAVLHIVNHVKTFACVFKPGFKKGTLTGEVYSLLTFREIEYLEHIKDQNMTTYGEVMRKLTKHREDMILLKRYFDNEISTIALL